MLVELTINPLGRGTHLSKDLAEILKVVDSSGLPYSLRPFGTCIEGDWDQVMGIVKQCHALAKASSHHVMTSIQIEDEDRAVNKLEENVAAVEPMTPGRQTARRCAELQRELAENCGSGSAGGNAISQRDSPQCGVK